MNRSDVSANCLNKNRAHQGRNLVGSLGEKLCHTTGVLNKGNSGLLYKYSISQVAFYVNILCAISCAKVVKIVGIGAHFLNLDAHDVNKKPRKKGLFYEINRKTALLRYGGGEGN